MLTSRSLFLAQVLAHLSLIPMIVYGQWHHWLIAIIVYFFNGCIGMTVTYHRLLSHRAWVAPKWLEYFGVLCASIGLTGSAISWVAIHRKHHRYTDTEHDPHSPTFKGFFYCHWLSMFEPVNIKFAMDLRRERFYLFQHRYYFYIAGVYAISVYLIDPFAVVYAFLVPACILWNAGSSIVSVAHMYGPQAHPINSKAANVWWLGLLVWGEGWHNNHHHQSNNPYFSEQFWQVDVGGLVIRILLALRIAKLA